jgi:hypothetical protein
MGRSTEAGLLRLTVLAAVAATIVASPVPAESGVLDAAAAEQEVSSNAWFLNAPPAPPVLTERKRLKSMTLQEQTRLLQSFVKMQEGGKASPFAIIAEQHGGDPMHPGQGVCKHAAANFVAWHRLHLFEFEKALQDAHEELFGDRNIGLPYWDWGTELFASHDPSSFGFHEILYPDASIANLVKQLGDKNQFQSLFGHAKPPDKQVGKIYDKGYKKVDAAKTWNHKTWNSCEDEMSKYQHLVHATLSGATGVFSEPFRAIIRSLEGMHNGIHLASGRPMNNLAAAAYHFLFYIHHAEIDRLFTQYAGYKAYLEQSFGGVENDFAVQLPAVFAETLAPFTKDDGSLWTSAGVLSDTRVFGYYYGDPQAIRPGPTGVAATAGNYSLSALVPGSKHHVAALALEQVRDSPKDIIGGGGLSVLQMIHHQAELHNKQVKAQSSDKILAQIVFGKESGCKLELAEKPFYAHFFMVPKDGPPLDPLPIQLDQLSSIDSYVGMASHFGGAVDARRTHPSFLEKTVELDHLPSAYDVIVMYDQNNGNTALLSEPTFWKRTAACSGKPVPDESWIDVQVLVNPGADSNTY